MIGFYNYTVILTYIGMLSGFAGINYIWHGDLKMALICLMICGICDMFDGKIASTMERTKQEKRFGVQIDSLSDLICFGVLPSLIVMQCAEGSFFAPFISALYLLCALIRLAWFNVDEEERQLLEDGGRETYLGLPVTSSALVIPFIMGICSLLSLPSSRISPFVLLSMAIAFLTPFSMKKPGNKGKLILMACGMVVFTIVFLGVIR